MFNKPFFEIIIPVRATSKKNSYKVRKNRRTGKHFIANDNKTKCNESIIKRVAIERHGSNKCSNQAMIFYAICCFRIPKSGINKGKKVGQHCNLTPDNSNIENMLHDALEGIVYYDDRQITESVTKRIWANEDSINIKIFEEDW